MPKVLRRRSLLEIDEPPENSCCKVWPIVMPSSLRVENTPAQPNKYENVSQQLDSVLCRFCV